MCFFSCPGGQGDFHLAALDELFKVPGKFDIVKGEKTDGWSLVVGLLLSGWMDIESVA